MSGLTPNEFVKARGTLTSKMRDAVLQVGNDVPFFTKSGDINARTVAALKQQLLVRTTRFESMFHINGNEPQFGTEYLVLTSAGWCVYGLLREMGVK